jgi:transcription elongation factor Elf1
MDYTWHCSACGGWHGKDESCSIRRLEDNMAFYICKRCGIKVEYDYESYPPPNPMLCEDCFLDHFEE